MSRHKSSLHFWGTEEIWGSHLFQQCKGKSMPRNNVLEIPEKKYSWHNDYLSWFFSTLQSCVATCFSVLSSRQSNTNREWKIKHPVRNYYKAVVKKQIWTVKMLYKYVTTESTSKTTVKFLIMRNEYKLILFFIFPLLLCLWIIKLRIVIERKGGGR